MESREHPGPSSIGRNLSELRKRNGLTQAELAKALGFKSAQIVSNIESGLRELKAHEAYSVSKILNVEFDRLLNTKDQPEPFVLWRELDPSAERVRLQEEAWFLLRCRRYAFIESMTREEPIRGVPQFQLDLDRWRFEDVEDLATKVRGMFDLGATPATQARSALEDQAGVKVFLADLKGGSGASTRGDFGDAILENRSEDPPRRAFSLAHELFHLLTWDAVAHGVAQLPEKHRNRNETLANVFASALLMPQSEIKRRFCVQGSDGASWARLLPIASAFAVSPPALVWRLFNLELIAESDRDRLLNARRGRDDVGHDDDPHPFPKRFVLLAFRAWAEARISMGKLAEVLETSIGLLPEVLADFGIDMERDAETA